MNTQQHIDGLFSAYEETAALLDFKEELKSNLDDRIGSLMKKGLTETAAFAKAIEELGNISVLADEISQKKRQEVFEHMYMKVSHYMTPKRVALYVLCGLVLGFGVVAALLSWFYSGDINSPLGTLLVFGTLALAGFLFLGLTQETAANEAMSWKRALWYTAAFAVFLFGLIVFVMTYFYFSAGSDPRRLPEAVATLIPFILPSLALGAFLLLTEKDRSKPWVVAQRNEFRQRELERFANPVQAERFGLVCGALWIAALAAFILLTITVGIKFSWLAFAAAIVAQLLVQANFASGKR
ncbi:MAG: permease prefix domain 1-containing protein [Peptococcaceae bacterium]|jgi:hypothetical protein|nr:permease prefix domain 1-containing protein [Peptococcaceae bacterium]